MVDFTVIRGNPVLQNDKDVDCLTKYNKLREVIRATKLDLVELDCKALRLEGFGVKRTIAYPKNAELATVEWVLNQVKAFADIAPFTASLKKAPKQVKPFLCLAERLINEGGTLEVIDDVLTLRRNTFEGRIGNFSALPDPIKVRAQMLIDKSDEVKRLRVLAQQNGLM